MKDRDTFGLASNPEAAEFLESKPFITDGASLPKDLRMDQVFPVRWINIKDETEKIHKRAHLGVCMRCRAPTDREVLVGFVCESCSKPDPSKPPKVVRWLNALNRLLKRA